MAAWPTRLSTEIANARGATTNLEDTAVQLETPALEAGLPEPVAVT